MLRYWLPKGSTHPVLSWGVFPLRCSPRHCFLHLHVDLFPAALWLLFLGLTPLMPQVPLQLDVLLTLCLPLRKLTQGVSALLNLLEGTTDSV